MIIHYLQNHAPSIDERKPLPHPDPVGQKGSKSESPTNAVNKSPFLTFESLVCLEQHFGLR